MPLASLRRCVIRGLVVLSTIGIALWSLQVDVAAAQAGPPRTVGMLPFVPFPQDKTLPDLTISHLEVTQVIQRWGDASPLVPLVRGKPTVVRVYVQASGGPGPGPGGTWSVTWTAIDVYHGSTYLDTLWQQGPVLVTPGADPKSLRDNAARTFNFLIPSSWTTFAEGLTLRVTINSQGGVPEFSSSNNSVSDTVTFRLTYPLTVAGLMFSDPKYPFPAKPYADFNTQLAFLNQTWPVPSANLFTPPNQDLHYGTPSNVDASDAYFPGGFAVANDADKRRLQATDASRGYYWYALQPWNTGLNGMACGVGTCRGATGQDNTGADAGAVMAQEIGHNWGQYHTGHVSTDNWFDPNCCPHGGISHSLSDLAYGFDTRTMQVIPPGPLSGSHAHDFMVGGCTGGCPTLPHWVSDYTYERLLNADTVRLLGQDQTQRAEAGDDQHIAALESQPAETRQYMLVSGHVGDGAALDPTYVLDQPAGTADDPGTGQFTLELRNDADEVLSARAFNPSAGMHDLSGPPSFVELLPWDAAAHSLVLRLGDSVVATRTASANPPVVDILTPRPGVHWNGARQVTWAASDPDGDDLVYAVHYSSDGGRTWLPVGVDLTDTSLDIDAGLLKGSTDCRIRVIASDGFNTTVAESEAFGVDPHEPTASLTAPPQLTAGRQAILHGTAYDADDGAVAEESLIWQSDRDGNLGSGSTVVTTPLSPGSHTITLRVTDSDGHPATASTTLDVPNTPTHP
jgi:hypothetical protein